MIRLHVSADGPPDPDHLADALRAIADDIASGGWSGDTVVDAWSGRSDVDLGLPVVVNKPRAGGLMLGPYRWTVTRFVTWSVTWDGR